MSRWLPVPGFEGAYEVSDQGQVRSLTRKNRIGRTTRGRVMRPGVAGRGYQWVTLCSGNRREIAYVHALVLSVFVEPRPEGMFACHNNGDRTDNRASNLRWGTRLDNAADAVKHGVLRRRGTHYATKITNECIDRIKDLVACGAKQRHVAAYFRVSPVTICRILQRLAA